MTEKTEAELVAEAAAAQLALAAIRRPRLNEALQLVEGLRTEAEAALLAQRDAMHDGPAKQSLAALLSVLTSVPGQIIAELASLPQEPAA